MFLLNILRPAPDSKARVPEGKIKKVFHMRQAGVFVATCGGYIGYYIARLAFTIEQQDIMKAYGLNVADIGFILAVFGISYGLSKFIMGVLSDKSNPRFYIALGLILSAFINVLLGSTGDKWIMMILMALMAVTQGMGAPACQKCIQVWWGRRNRGTFFSIWSSAHNLGAFCATEVALLASYIFVGSTHAASDVFYLSAVFSVIIAVIVIIVGADRPVTVGLPSIQEFTGEKVADSEGEIVSDDEGKNLTIIQIFVKYILKSRAVWYLSIASGSLYLVRMGIMQWIPTYLPASKGFGVDEAKFYLGLFELAAVPGVILLGFLSDKLTKGRRTPVALVTVFVLFGSLFIYWASDSKAMITAALLVMGSLIYAPLTLIGLMINESVPKFAVGSSTGFMGFWQYIYGTTLASAVMGILAQSFGWTAGFIMLGIGGILTLICLFLTYRLEKKEFEVA